MSAKSEERPASCLAHTPRLRIETAATHLLPYVNLSKILKEGQQRQVQPLP
jgi:hypothetical protein